MKPIHKLIFPLLGGVLAVSVAAAQDADCAAQIQKIIEAARQACSEVGRNQACYGHPTIDIQPQPNVGVKFAAAGDTVALSAIQSFTLGAFDTTSESGGVAVMKVGAITLVAFGDVELQNLNDTSDNFIAMYGTVSEPKGAYVREKPSEQSPVVSSVNYGATLVVIGRLDDSSWVRIAGGWISPQVLSLEGDILELEVLESDSTANVIYGPMQSFHLYTGEADSPCVEISDSGVLVQSLDTTEFVILNVNGPPLVFSGTLLLQTTSEGTTIVSVLEGKLSYDGSEILEAGQRMEYGYRGEKIQFELPEDYNYARARYLPLQLLPREIELPFSLGGVIFPFAPGTGFLSSIPADAACTAAWSVDVNIRSGPGTNYPIRRGVSGGYYAHPDARAVGSDGAIWWRLAESIWLAANNTAAAGDCGNLPLVEPPPVPAD